jgi:histone-lysine N-methyltransferase SETMAR
MFVNSERYIGKPCDQLNSAIRRNRHGLLSYGACLQHDDIRPHAAIHTVKQIVNLKLEALSRPPYAPGFSPIDFHLIWPLKDVISDRVRSVDVKDVVLECLAYRPKDFF